MTRSDVVGALTRVDLLALVEGRAAEPVDPTDVELAMSATYDELLAAREILQARANLRVIGGDA